VARHGGHANSWCTYAPRPHRPSVFSNVFPNEMRFLMATKLRAPRHLKAATGRWWLSVASSYVMEAHHLRLLTLAAEAWDRCTQAREALSKHGLVYLDRFDQPRARPEIAIERDNRLAFARLIRELALDVSSPEESRPPRNTGRAG
jgi:phage terminase small subunit